MGSRLQESIALQRAEAPIRSDESDVPSDAT